MSTKYLFIDRHHVEWLDGLRQVFHRPVKHPTPVMVPDQPWEDCQVRVDTPPLWDAQRETWRLWYSGGDTLLPLYAESPDGLHWTRPALGRVDWKGSRENNIVNERKAESQEEDSPIPHALFVRDEEDRDEARRYKGMAWIRERDENRQLLGTYLIPHASPNGMDWTPIEGADRIPCEDTKQLAYDSLKGRFIAMVKGLTGAGVKTYGAAELGRIVYLSVSDDFARWSDPELVFHADEIDRELGRQRIEEAVRNPDRRGPLTVRPDEFFTDVYFLPVFVYEDLYLGLPILFHQSGHYFSSKSSNQDGLTIPVLAASRDLCTWDRLDRQPFIAPSLLSDPHLFDTGCIYGCPPVRHGNELWFYYHGSRYSHTNPEMTVPLKSAPNEPTSGIFMARLRLDGFASLRAGEEPGLLVSKPVRVEGKRLCLNAAAARGEIRVELRDAVTGRGIPGFCMGDYMGSRVLRSEDGKRGRLRIGPGARFLDDPEEDDTVPISEDGVDIDVRWKGGSDLSALQGREVRLFIRMRSADLYAFQFAPAPVA